jgi:site-specific DNA-methyltransferase (adenine-specific)
MLGLVKITQNTMKKAYSFVPMQDFSEPWTDEKLYKKYGLSKDEIAFIEKMVRPMDADTEPDDE